MRRKFDALHARLSSAIARLRAFAMAQATRQPSAPLGSRLRHRDEAQSVELTELLGRKPVNLDTPELQRFIAGKVVLVTGAGGSIGSGICPHTMRVFSANLVALD